MQPPGHTDTIAVLWMYPIDLNYGGDSLERRLFYPNRILVDFLSHSKEI
jgi:hypothetical protein